MNQNSQTQGKTRSIDLPPLPREFTISVTPDTKNEAVNTGWENGNLSKIPNKMTTGQTRSAPAQSQQQIIRAALRKQPARNIDSLIRDSRGKQKELLLQSLLNK